MEAGMKVGDLVAPRRDKYKGPGTPALVIDITQHPRGNGVLILVGGKAIWVGGSMLEVISEAG